MAASANIARHLPAMALAFPQCVALKVPKGRSPDGRIDYLTLTFSELDAEVNAWMRKLNAGGIRQGDRVLLMVRQGLPLIAGAFALFAHGAVPVVIDPGMGLKNFLSCVRRSKPDALLGIPLARVLSHVFFRAFRSVRSRVTAHNSPLARLCSTTTGASSGEVLTRSAHRSNGDLAAILFTSGSTGSPKGVCYEHGMFDAQVRLIQQTYKIEPGEVDLPMLPIFALFNPALGMTTIVPEIDPSRPAQVDPARIVQAIQQEGVTNSFGSPTLWNKIAEWCSENGKTLPTLKRVLCAGAPVPRSLWERSRTLLPHGKLHSPYGATECLPVSSVSSDEINPASTAGACVGRPVQEMEVRVIRLSDEPIERLEQTETLPCGEVGEMIVKGPVVTKAYDQLPEANAAAKISGQAGELWHRLGDCGYIDTEGRLWFCGRKVERVVSEAATFYTEPCEQVFRAHRAVARCALIGLGAKGKQQPALAVQLRSDAGKDAKNVAAELRELGRKHLHTAGITRFYFHPAFPVDVRHNAKIHRLTLAKWAIHQRAVEVV